MFRPLASRAGHPAHEDEKAPERFELAATVATKDEAAFTEAGSATVAALLHLLRLMGAELVLTLPGGDPARLEQAVRAKIEHFTSPTTSPLAREAGLAHARHLVEHVLLQIRAQAELRKTLAATSLRQTKSSTVSAMPHPSTLLN
jgi:hypothetical protein